MSKVKYIKGKCESGIEGCGMPSKRRKAAYNLYHTVDGVKTWKNVCDKCEEIIGDENVCLWTEAQARGTAK